MPRHDDRDRYGNTRLYVGRLSSRTRARDLEDFFSRYGRVRDVDMKRDFAFVDFKDPRDADEARYNLDGREFDGSRLIVEFARGGPRGGGGSREYLGRGPPPGTGRCFNCGIDGHWARDCKGGDQKNKCYRCGDRGHIERNCPNSSKKSSRQERSYSRSVSRSPSPRRGRSSSRSYSQSLSPPAKRVRGGEDRKSMSRDHSRSPKRQGSSPPKRSRSHSPDGNRRHSPSPLPKEWKPSVEHNGSDYRRSPRRDQTSRSPRRSPVPEDHKQQNGSKYTQSPRRDQTSRSPVPEDRKQQKTGSEYNQSPRRERDSRSQYDDHGHQSLEVANGRSLSPGGENNDDHRSP